MAVQQRLLTAALALVLLCSRSSAISHDAEPTLNEPFQKSFAKLPSLPCYSLFHRNGRFGCGTSSRESQKGILKYLDVSLEKFPNYMDPYVWVVEEKDFTYTTVSNILLNNKWGLCQGVLVVNSTRQEGSTSSYSSPDAKYPQGYNTPSVNVNYGTTDYGWNSRGSGVMYADLHGVPVSYVAENPMSNYMKAVSKSDEADMHIVAQFTSYMGPSTMDSPTCLSWKDESDDVWRPKCLPLGGTSVWATAGSPERTSQANNRELDDTTSSTATDSTTTTTSSNSAKPIVMIATSIDSTSMFRDAAPGANTAASNILALLLAAKLLGSSVNDSILDNLNKRILFGFFQGEQYGFLGSRRFLKDVLGGFECRGKVVPAVFKLGEDSEKACLNPLRPSLEFQDLGEIAGMLTVDQVGLLATSQTLYAHSDGSNFGGFLSNVLQASTWKSFGVSQANAENGAYPPTPLTSLLQISDGEIGGAILTGYDNYFTSANYHSHRDSIELEKIDLDAIAAAATVLARTALAAAYDDGSYASNTASQYAANLISDLSPSDETLVALADCLFKDGSCDLLRTYAQMEAKNDVDRTGIELATGGSLGQPPNYYVSVYDLANGQPFVQVGQNWYGAYSGEDYGSKSTDAVSMRPMMLEAAIRGMLNDFLGRGSLVENSDGSTSEPNYKRCSATSNCNRVNYCANDGDKAVCTGGGRCVCRRAHYHIALDEGLEAAADNFTGYFVISDDDAGISPMFTEPYWATNAGSVRVYRDSKSAAGLYTLASGIFFVMMMITTAWLVKQKMKKQKLL